MDMFKAYKKEREGQETLLTDYGFATYEIKGEDLICYDIYIKPEFRRTHKAFEMGDLLVEIGRAQGAKNFIGMVAPSMRGAHQSLLGLIKYGLTIYQASNDIIFLRKVI